MSQKEAGIKTCEREREREETKTETETESKRKIGTLASSVFVAVSPLLLIDLLYNRKDDRREEHREQKARYRKRIWMWWRKGSTRKGRKDEFRRGKVGNTSARDEKSGKKERGERSGSTRVRSCVGFLLFFSHFTFLLSFLFKPSLRFFPAPHRRKWT